MRTRFQKWGNGRALRIPKALANQAGIQNGTLVEVSILDRKLIIAPTIGTRLTLRHLLTKVNNEHLHHEFDAGSPIGREW
ncbi:MULTISPECIES: AbrB/MazE/SpoVT family DNA-binding domain-containing protein [Dehalococcoides]|uniref:SpoVT-AbrB domain-containing protein n=1 Tax=bioreactor metagenome TaxID=1076179 RepID=A0A644TD76_9ZZZZ